MWRYYSDLFKRIMKLKFYDSNKLQTMSNFNERFFNLLFTIFFILQRVISYKISYPVSFKARLKKMLVR